MASLWLRVFVVALVVIATSVGERTCQDENFGIDHEACVDTDTRCPQYAADGYCESTAHAMFELCRKSCGTCTDLTMGVPQRVSAEAPLEWKQRLETCRKYLDTVVAKDPLQRKYVLDKCKNQHELCTFWALRGRCETHRGYMKTHCAPVCQTCHELSAETKCPYNPETMPDAWKAGDLDEFFTNITTMEQYKQYEPRVLSRPNHIDAAADLPWIVTLDNVITEEEANRLIELGELEGYKRSVDVGADGAGQVYDGRTSSSAWCMFNCFNDTLVQRVQERLDEITNIPERNSEYWQILKYEHNQYYHRHHDYNPVQKERQQGVRILTVYLYLNDVPDGGGTRFTELDITVQPKRGRILIWPSVLNEDPNERDRRTYHEALAPINSVKYGANAWIHLRDFKTPLHNGCP